MVDIQMEALVFKCRFIYHAGIQEFLPGGVQAQLPENSPDIFFFLSVRNLFYSFTAVYQWISKKTITKGYKGGPTFSSGGGGGSNIFQGVQEGV